MTLVRTATLIATSVALATVGLALTSAPAQAAAKPGVVNCKGKPEVQPKEINMSCADANLTVTGLKWSTWTKAGATGTGTLVWNPCIPTCVAGKAEKYPAKVVLSRVASGAGVNVFSGMTLAFTKGGPADAAASSYVLDNPLK
jgi:membrane-bound inhibitor of C-type lysozyme